MSTHEPACLALKAQEQAFRLTYPQCCVFCAGKGHIETFGTGQYQPCGDCMEDGTCPRCGVKALIMHWREEGSYRACQACDWDEQVALSPEGQGYGMVAPTWECICEEETTSESV